MQNISILKNFSMYKDFSNIYQGLRLLAASEEQEFLEALNKEDEIISNEETEGIKPVPKKVGRPPSAKKKAQQSSQNVKDKDIENIKPVSKQRLETKTSNSIEKEAKRNSSKKSRVKNKIVSLCTDVKTYSEKTLPRNLVQLIKNQEYPMKNVDASQQKSCAEFFSKNNKYEIMLTLFQHIKTQEELDFFRNTFLKKKYLDLLFSCLNNNEFQ